jgi:uncharacterized protein YkwD/outer membrane protein OmpA-like peptidoglycan-associated protein
MRHSYFTLVFILFLGPLYSQKKNKGSNAKQAAAENFNLSELSDIIFKEINRFRQSKGLDTLANSEMLAFSADLSSEKMASSGKDKIDRKTTVKHLKYSGATRKGEEVTMKAPINKGREYYSTAEVAKIIYSKWESSPKYLPIILNPKHTSAGVFSYLDDEGKKVFVSAVLGGYDIHNNGAEFRKEMTVPYNTKSKKLKAPDLKTCKSCERWRNYDLLHKGLFVEDGKVYLKYPNAKELKRLLKKPVDGLAFDIVQREQYANADYNILDNNLHHKGLMSKIIYRDQFFKKNRLIKKKDKQSKKIKGIEVELGKFNQKITGEYEINLLIIQDKKVCKTITRGYYESGKIESKTPIGLIPTINSTGLNPPFEPRSESSIISFMVPFEKNKSEFKDSDIQPLVKALNEPDFIIDGLYIYAYSSIEGDSAANAKLQRKRAEGIANVLQSKQQNKIFQSIETKDSWGLFLLENEDGPYADIVNLGKRKAIAKINGDKNLLDKLEPLLARGRFAQVIMDITYDVSGNKEQNFSKVSFRRAAKAGKQAQAYKILELINRRVMERKYPESIFDSLQLEENVKNAGLINNRIYYKYQMSNQVEEEDEAAFGRLLKLDPANPVFQYNKIFCELKLDTNAMTPQHQAQVQQTIDGFYGKLDSNYVNGLNIEWQFKIMENIENDENADAIIDACIARIKSFYDLRDASWQNALKLSYVFSRAKDFKYAATLLEPFLSKSDVNENLIFMYIASASRIPEKYYSLAFARALDLAQEKNPERYCKLFGEPFMTFQVLENPEVKKTYIKNCRK